MQIFRFDPVEMDHRLRARPTPAEWVGMGIVVVFIVVFGLIQTSPYDYTIYINTWYGESSGYYYAYWFNPVFALFAPLGYPLGYFAWDLLSMSAVFLASRVFGGRTLLALLSFQMFYSLWFGQITGMIVGGLALLWWGLAHRRWNLAGLGLLIACTKVQAGVIPGLVLLLGAEIAWRERLRVLVVPVVGAALSLIIYPLWPLEVLHELQRTPPIDLASISLWKLIGPAALALWLPPLLLPMPRSRRSLALLATTALALPYFQQAELLMLFVFPVGLLPVLGLLGYPLLFIWSWQALQWLLVVPLAAYAWLIFPAAVDQFRQWRGKASPGHKPPGRPQRDGP